MTSHEYLTFGGVYCPECHSTNIKSGRLEADGTTAWAQASCLSCDSSWKDVYELVGIENLVSRKT